MVLEIRIICGVTWPIYRIKHNPWAAAVPTSQSVAHLLLCQVMTVSFLGTAVPEQRALWFCKAMQWFQIQAILRPRARVTQLLKRQKQVSCQQTSSHVIPVLCASTGNCCCDVNFSRNAAVVVDDTSRQRAHSFCSISGRIWHAGAPHFSTSPCCFRRNEHCIPEGPPTNG